MDTHFSDIQQGILKDKHHRSSCIDCVSHVNRSKYTILVVDDTPLNLTVATKILEILGYKSDTAKNGAQSVQKVAEGSYDLVLMDCHMPVMDGYEATIAIRRLPEPACNIPIIALTAYSTIENRDKCRAVGMNAFLEKPLQRDRLDYLISQWVCLGVTI